jgi:serine/threonine-protein kinase
MADVAPGHVLGRYELLLPIAAGGMAMVWAARVKGTRGFQKIVAVKTMLSILSEDEQFEQMFLDEASLASQIRHPNVVEISDLGEQDGVLYLAMEWIDGVPLNQVMKTAKASGGVPLPIAVRIVMNACAGLHAAHELRDAQGRLIGLVHRDVSPQNILVTYDGVSKVVDFGVAKATALGGSATVAGQLKGKVSYMAPEQVRGEPIDRRIDVFALGIVLYALTTGKHPFRRESEAATMYNIASDEAVVPPRKVRPDYPPTLEAVLLKALAKDPANRYATASEFLRALDQSLPASERANTDEDIAQFIRKLFGNRREESRAALAEALALADKQGPRPEKPINPLRQSHVSQLSEVIPLPSAPAAETTFTAVGTPDAIRRRQRLRLAWAAGAIVVVAGAIGFGLRSSPPTPARLPVAGAHANTTGTPAHDLPKAPKVVSEAPAVLPPSAAQEVAPRPPAAAGRAPGPRPPVTSPPAVAVTPPPAVTPAKPVVKPATPAWRQDPGF